MSADLALEVRDIAVRFGGITAVDGFSMTAPIGQITGLIGPNGAGKTTTFNACSGHRPPDTGIITLFGDDVTSMGPAARAQHGLGRTFQRMQLFGSMTVRENVAMGREAGYAGRNPIRLLRGGAAERREVEEATDDAIHRCGLGELADAHIGELSTGQRRLVELARVAAGRFRLLLLDEPCSGLDRDETDRMGDLLEELVAERDLAIVLVEHDMEVALRICAHLHVLDFGKPIFEGTPDQVRTSDIVKRAYLGDDPIAQEQIPA